MADTGNLEMRGRIWWVYRTVPPALRAMIGRRTLRRSLGTSDLAEALTLRPRALAEFNEQLTDARRALSSVTDPAAKAAIVWHRTAPTVPDEHRLAVLLAERATLEAKHGQAAGARFQALASEPPALPLAAHLDTFHAEMRAVAKTKAEQRRAVQRLQEWKPGLSLHAVDRRTAGRYVFEGLGFTDSPVTKNKQITLLSSYWRWLVRRGIVDDNPWREQSLPVAKAVAETGKERAFSDQELALLLTGPAEPRLADAMRIAALSGMRIEEICLLRVADCADGTFSVRKAKTSAGIRHVPIHSALTTLVERRCKGKRPTAFLFDELGPCPTADAVRARSDPLSKQFTRYRRDLGIDAVADGQRRSQVNFHSFRRWFVTKAEHAGVPPWTIASVVGHKRSGMTLGVYSQGSSAEQLRVCVEAVRLP